MPSVVLHVLVDAMSALTCCTDWRDPMRWTAQEKARMANLWSLFWTATEDNTANLSGDRLVAFQPGIPINPDGTVSGHPYAQALADVVTMHKGRTGNVLFPGADGGYLELIDMTRRGLAVAIANLRHHMFGWAAGHHLDYFTRPDSLNIRDGNDHLVTYTESYLLLWDNALLTLTSTLRSLKPDGVLIGQCDRLAGSTWGAMSGQWVENWWGYNNRTAVIHASDIKAFADLMARYEPGRSLVSVVEIMEPEKFTTRELDLVRAWTMGQGLYMSTGRGAAARGAM